MAAALAGGADVIVTGDADLLADADLRAWLSARGVTAMRPTELPRSSMPRRPGSRNGRGRRAGRRLAGSVVRSTTRVKIANDVFRFVLELCMLAALGFGGFESASGSRLRPGDRSPARRRRRVGHVHRPEGSPTNGRPDSHLPRGLPVRSGRRRSPGGRSGAPGCRPLARRRPASRPDVRAGSAPYRRDPAAI